MFPVDYTKYNYSKITTRKRAVEPTFYSKCFTGSNNKNVSNLILMTDFDLL